MTPKRRIWHIAIAAVLLLLLISCRMAYWHLVRVPAYRPDASGATANPEKKTREGRVTGTAATATSGVATQTPGAGQTSAPTEKPHHAVGPIGTSEPAFTRLNGNGSTWSLFAQVVGAAMRHLGEPAEESGPGPAEP
jgi:hypothetical protein